MKMYKIKGIRIILLLSIFAALYSFKIQDEDKFTVDTRRSSIEWKATKVGGGHHGTVNLSSGYLLFNNNSLTGGAFVADMTSITVAELKGYSKENLLNHLKSGDFFDVADYPTSSFKITKVSPAGNGQVTITGNLTIKGITNLISFSATVQQQEKTVAATAKGIKVDRTKFDIKYRSLSFFSGIADQAIDDEFELSVNLVAKK